MVRFKLIPIGNGSEHLNILHLVDSNPPLPPMILGRNITTGRHSLTTVEQSRFLSRSQLHVSVDRGKVFIRPLCREVDMVYLNGLVLPSGMETEMHLGDTVSLLGKLNLFNFILELEEPLVVPNNNKRSIDVVEIDDTPPSKRPMMSKTAESILSCEDSGSDDDEVVLVDHIVRPSPTAVELDDSVVLVEAPIAAATNNNNIGQELNTSNTTPCHAASKVADLRENLHRNYECAICMDTMAYAVSLVPCGDTFCYECIQQCAQKDAHCPLCKAAIDIDKAVPLRIVHSSIQEIIKSDAEALASWERRSEEGLRLFKERTAAVAAAAMARKPAKPRAPTNTNMAGAPRLAQPAPRPAPTYLAMPMQAMQQRAPQRASPMAAFVDLTQGTNRYGGPPPPLAPPRNNNRNLS